MVIIIYNVIVRKGFFIFWKFRYLNFHDWTNSKRDTILLSLEQ